MEEYTATTIPEVREASDYERLQVARAISGQVARKIAQGLKSQTVRDVLAKREAVQMAKYEYESALRDLAEA